MTMLDPAPSAYSEEFSQGYWARSHRFKLRARYDVVSQVRAASKIEWGLRHPLTAVAKTAGIELQQLVKDHTLLPLFGAFTHRDQVVDHGSPGDEILLRTYGTRIGSAGVQYCRECMQMDLKHLGTSYWRRVHQIRGVTHCPTHHLSLVGVGRGPWIFDRCPHQHEEARVNSSQWRSEMEPPHQVVSRYVEICMGLLRMERPVPIATVREMIGRLARDVGVPCDKADPTNSILKFLSCRLPEKWAGANFPPVTRGARNYSSRSRTFTFGGGATPAEWIILMCAALHDTAGEALKNIRQLHAV